MEIQKVRDELKPPRSASRRVAEAERGAKQARVDLERLAADKLSAEEHLEVKLASALAEKEDADTRADEARRVAEDLQANEPMERAIEFEKRVASAVAELERAVAAEREKAEAAETSVQQLTFKLGSLQHELETAQAELEPLVLRGAPGGQGRGARPGGVAACRVAPEARDARSASSGADAEGGAATAERRRRCSIGPGASAAHIAAAQAAAEGRAGAAARATGGDPGSGDKTAEELELEDLLNEVMALKGEAGDDDGDADADADGDDDRDADCGARGACRARADHGGRVRRRTTRRWRRARLRVARRRRRGRARKSPWLRPR